MEVLLMTLLTVAPTDDAFVREFALTRRFTAGRPVGVRVTPDGKSAVYLRSGPTDGRQMLFSLDLETGVETQLLTPDEVLGGASETLSVAEKARLERQRVSARGFISYRLSPDGQRLLVALSGKLYLVERATKKVTQLKTGEGPCIDANFSPDGKLVGYVRGYDVYVVDLASNTERAVTHGGTELKPHGLAEYIAQEEMGRFSGYWFAADSKSLLYQQTDHAGVERFGIPDPMHPEAEVQRFFYPRPGHANASVSLFIQPLVGGAPVRVQWDQAAYPYLATVTWKDGPLTLVVQARDQRREQVLSVDPKTGHTSLLLAEEDDAWLNLSQSFPLWWKDHGFFWLTERNGGPEVELRGVDGSLKERWVAPEAGFGGLVGFAADSRTLTFMGGTNPTESHVFQVTDGGAPTRLGEGGAVYEMASKTGPALVLTRMTPTSMPQVSVRLASGKQVAVPSVAHEPSLAMSTEFFKLDDAPGSYVAINRPKDFVKGKKYPVILSVYGGPHRQVVMQTMDLKSQWLADQGFIVVRADGRGTPGRGRAWERAIAHDFATLIAADQVAALRGAAQRVPEMDLTRVGTFGWSFGGYLAGLLGLSRPDVFKSAIAGAPVVDWRDYDTHYTERYLGLVEQHPQAYEVSSLLSYVDQAQRPLLLMHGTADDNVYFLHTLKLSDALFKAGKPHAVLPLANFTHMVPDPLVTQREWERIASWFKETL